MLRPSFSYFFGIATCFLLVFSAPRAGAQTTGTVDIGDLVITNDKDGNGISVNSLVGADRFYNYGTTGIWGQGTVTANVEAGLIWDGAPDLTGVTDYYVPSTASNDFDQHATWVGSVLAGFDSVYAKAHPDDGYPYQKLGMAPGTFLSSGAIATEFTSGGGFNMTAQTFYSTYSHYFTASWTQITQTSDGISITSIPTDVINSSWGLTPDTTGQSMYTMAVDGMARANPLTTLVVAAGNSTDASITSNNVGGPASGFNSISVGAVGNFTYNNFTSVSEFSSRGPQDYYDPVHGLVAGVRAPVDIVAPGTSIVVANYGGATGGQDFANTDPYVVVAGTSFASPIVAGGVSLLKSLSYTTGMGPESRDTRVIKAVLMNSATKLPGWDNGQSNVSGVTVTTQALDWAQGAGMINLNRAFDQYNSGTKDVPGLGGGSVLTEGWDYGALQLNQHNDYAIHFTLQATAVLDVTLSWFRNLGNTTLDDNIDPDQQTLTTEDLGFANLYLEIWDADFTHLFATSMTQYNSVQELHYTLPADGEYGIRVVYFKQMYGVPVEEDYGLAWDTESAAQPVPEPGVMALSGLGCWMVLSFALRKRAALRENS